MSNDNNRIDIFKINKNNNIPDDIIKPMQHIIQNCEQNQGAISSKEFIMKGSLLFDKLTINFNDFVDIMQNLGKDKNLEIHCMHEDIFNLMHKI